MQVPSKWPYISSLSEDQVCNVNSRKCAYTIHCMVDVAWQDCYFACVHLYASIVYIIYNIFLYTCDISS